jgi:hypothetical protein
MKAFSFPALLVLPVAFFVSSSNPATAQKQSYLTRANASASSGGVNTAPNEWTWTAGSTAVNQKGIFGTMVTPAATNAPGGTDGAATWTDSSGNLWLFGGTGNILWRYAPSTNEWTWMTGDNGGTTSGTVVFQSAGGVYGTLGVPSPNNTPGSRQGAVSWADRDGNFWLFGGFGNIGTAAGYLNDLWEYSPTTNEWVWVSGSNAFSCSGGIGHAEFPPCMERWVLPRWTTLRADGWAHRVSWMPMGTCGSSAGWETTQRRLYLWPVLGS